MPEAKRQGVSAEPYEDQRQARANHAVVQQVSREAERAGVQAYGGRRGNLAVRNGAARISMTDYTRKPDPKWKAIAAILLSVIALGVAVVYALTYL